MNRREQALAQVSELWAQIDAIDVAEAEARELWRSVPQQFPPTTEQRDMAEQFEAATALAEQECDRITADIARIRWEAYL